MDIAQFRLDFPEFSDIVKYPDSMIEFWSNLGEQMLDQDRLMSVYVQAVELFTAHNIVIAYQNNAAAGGNPWDVLIEGGYTAADIMKILVAVAAGKSTITDNGDGTMTVDFRDLDDTLNRVEADVDNSERTDVTFDLT